MTEKPDWAAQKREEQEAKKKLAEIFEAMGAKVTGWLLREDYVTELAFSVACAELDRDKPERAVNLYTERFGDERFQLLLGNAMIVGTLHCEPDEAKELLRQYREEYQKAKEPLQASC